MLETDRLLLRPPTAGPDTAVIAEELADPDVMRFIGTGETGTMADAVDQVMKMERAWREDGFGRFIVIRKSDHAPLGRVGLLAWDPHGWKPGIRSEIGDQTEIELGWTLLRSAWGRGFATEAATAARDWATEHVRPRRLISLIHPDNQRSKRVAAKIGEHLETTITTHRGVAVQLWTL